MEVLYIPRKGIKSAQGITDSFPSADSGIFWGDGLEVTGKAVDLLLAVSGCKIVLGLLEGPGAQQLIEAD